MRLRRTAGLAVLLVAGCGSGAPATTQATTQTTTPAGTVVGRVLSAPSCPVMQTGVPCPPRQVPGATVIALRAGHVVASTRTDARGAFRLNVPLGRCAIRATNAGGYQSTASRVVTVRADGPVHVRLVVDSGIR